jgi:fatty acid desaturase
VEWPTVAVALAIAGGFAAVLAAHESIPTVVVVALLAVLGAWYNSLQHEVIHGHPTPWRAVNTAMATLPIGLVVPFAVYRDSHLAHHRADPLTSPDTDPESFYVSVETWRRCGPVRRATLLALRTLAGRLVLGPLVATMRWWRGMVVTRSRRVVFCAVTHIAGVAVVLVVVAASGLPVWTYIVGVAWCGGALSLLRSFVEHRLSDQGTRSAVVHAGWFFSLLFLNNNLHHTHHARPGVPWFELPGLHARLDADRIAAVGAGLYTGYAEIARRYLVRPFDRVVVPGGD